MTNIKLYNTIFNNWLNKGSENLDYASYRFYKWSKGAYISGALSHSMFILLFLWIKAPIMAYVNIIDVLVFILCLYLLQRKKFVFGVLLGGLEVIVHASLAVYFTGWQIGFQYYIFLVPGAVFFIPKRKQISIFFIIVSCIVYVLLYNLFAAKIPYYIIESNLISLIHSCNLIICICLLSVWSYFYSKAAVDAEKALQVQFDRAEGLLANILPKPIAERLKEKQQLIADGYGQVSVLFADIYKFTEYSSTMKPYNLVQILNKLFSAYDDLVEKYNIEKIKTIGDCYMVTSGLPVETNLHAANIINYAFDMLDETSKFNKTHGTNF